MARRLPARPNLDHLRRQAKTLLSQLHDGDPAAAQAFIDHLPAARRMSLAAARDAGFRLADAQAVVARRTGFGAWPALARHVRQLRTLEGEWRFASLEVDGAAMPAGALGQSRLLIDGDRFRMESPEAVYDGVFTIDVEEKPARIDIEFVEGPEAGNCSYGIYAIAGDRLTLCLGLTGASRPKGFSTKAGSGHALERLERASAARPASVTGGTRRVKGPVDAGRQSDARAATVGPVAPADANAFDGPMTPMLRRLEGEWAPVELVMDGTPMQSQWLPFGTRTAKGREVKIVFGGQTMVHAKVRVDEPSTPVAIDYLYLAGGQKGRIGLGILEWTGDETRFLTAVPGRPRPADFSRVAGKGLTYSRWRRK